MIFVGVGSCERPSGVLVVTECNFKRLNGGLAASLLHLRNVSRLTLRRLPRCAI